MRRITLGDTLDLKFTTISSTGAPITLAGSPVISAYPGNSTTQLTAGITLTVDFDSVTGLHNVRVVASGGNGYAADTEYTLVITTGTVDSVSAVGYVIGEFSTVPAAADVKKLLGTAWLTPGTAGTPDVNVKLWNGLSTVALPLVPTTAGRTLDVSATGEAGLDWANVGSPTTSLALTGTTIATTQKVDVETIKTNPVVNGGTITFPTTATLASKANTDAIQADTDDIQARLPAALTAGGKMKSSMDEILAVAQSATDLKDFADDGYDPATNKVQGVVLTDTVTTYTGNTPQTGDAFARIGVAGAGLTNIDLPNQTMDIAGNITGNLSGSVGSVTGAVGSVTGAVGSVTGAVGSVTGNVGGNVTGSVGSVAAGGIAAASFAAGAIDATAIAADAIGSSELAATAANEIADAIIARNVSGGSSAGRLVKHALAALRNKQEIAGGTLTVYDVDDTTPLWDAAVTTAAGNPLASIDPS
jgi:hypothetical protein